MRFYNGFGDKQTHADARILAAGGIAHAVKPLEDVIEKVWTDANAPVADTHQVLVALFFQRHRYLFALWRKLDGVIQNIANHLADTQLIRDEFAILRLDIEKDGMLFRADLRQTHAFGQHIRQDKSWNIAGATRPIAHARDRANH